MSQDSSEKVPGMDIVLKARSGDDEALSGIFDEFRGYIRYLSKKYYLAGADSDDLVQEGMIGLFKAIRDFSADEGVVFRTFAKVCIQRQIKTAIKVANRQKHFPLNSSVSLHSEAFRNENNELVNFFTADSDNPEEIYINNETYAQMNKLLFNSLSKLELQILLLYNKGLTYKEMSDISGKSAKSVDNAVQRIKKKIEKIKKDYLSL